MLNTAVALNQTPAREYANALAAGTALMEYRLERVLGAGGFGITYLGWDSNLEKHVAVKEYLPAQLAVRALDGSVVPIATEQKYDYVWGLERFVQEARTLARFSHPHIVRVIRYIEANGTAYMVMEYEAGQSLAQWLSANPNPEETELRALAQPLLDGLEAMHAQGFLHRDIKPANVFVRENGTPVLLDFGAARQAVGHKSMSLTSIVSPGYAPLEQYASDGNQGPWTDVYSLSAVIFRAVTGQNPPEAVSRMKVDRVSQYLDGVAGRYSATFLAAIKLGMAVDEKMRPQSVAELRPVLLSESHSSSRDSQVAPRAKTTIVSMPSTAKRARSAPGMSAASRHATRKRSAQPWGWIGVGLVAAAGIGLMLTVKSAPTPAPNPGVVTQRAAPGPTAPAAPVEQPRAEQPAQAPAPSASESQPPAPVPVHTPAIAPLAEATVPPPAPVRPIDPGVVFPKAAPHLPKPPPKSNPALARDFQAADTDGDGAISAAEARARMPRLARDFERADANRDGRVTLIELQRFIHSGAEKGALP